MDKIANGFTVQFSSRLAFSRNVPDARTDEISSRDGRKERDRNSKNERLLASSDHRRHRNGSILSRLTSHKLSNLQHAQWTNAQTPFAIVFLFLFVFLSFFLSFLLRKKFYDKILM